MAGTLLPIMQVMRDIGGVKVPERFFKSSGTEELSEQIDANGRADSPAQHQEAAVPKLANPTLGT